MFQNNVLVDLSASAEKSSHTHHYSESNQNSAGGFSILDHLDALNIVKETSYEYHCTCPVCGDGGFKVNKRTGKYKTFKCYCMDTEIGKQAVREAFAPLPKRSQAIPYSSRPNVPRKKKEEKQKAKSPVVIQLARLPRPVTDSPKPYPCPKHQIGNIVKDSPEGTTRQIFSYPAVGGLSSQFVYRYQWPDSTRPKGYNKTFRQFHTDEQGGVVVGKGTALWLPYRWDEVVRHGTGKWVMAGEGEACVEAVRSIGLASFTLQGSNWGESEIRNACYLAKSANVAGIVFSPDNDETGQKKAAIWEKVANEVSLSLVILSQQRIWDDLPVPEKGDIADFIIAILGGKTAMDIQEFISRLEREIHTAVEAKETAKQESQLTEDDVLELDIKAYLAISRIATKKRLKADICGRYHLRDSDFRELCLDIELRSQVSQRTVFSFGELMEEETDALRWIVPGWLPVGEVVLLASLAKRGKSLLATDIAYAVVSGGEVLGEKVEVKGRVLYVNSDESRNSLKRRFLARGFDLLSESLTNLRIETQLDINDLSKLETHLEDFRPDLVIIDSLTSITLDSGVSEKDAEFAKLVYKLKDLIGRYGASGILIHHENKNQDAKGTNRVSGTARLPAAVWGTWQLQGDEHSESRILSVVPREASPSKICIERNPKDLWASQSIFRLVGEIGSDGEPSNKTERDRILDLLRDVFPRSLEAIEISQLLGVDKKYVYKVLNNLEDRCLVSKRKSLTNPRRWVYAIPSPHESVTISSTPPPSPSFISSEGDFTVRGTDI